MTENELTELFAKNVRRLRFERGWSQAKLAETIGLSTNFVSDIETRKGWVSPATLAALASAFQIEVKDLFGGETSESTEVRRIMDRLTEDLVSLVSEIKSVLNAPAARPHS